MPDRPPSGSIALVSGASSAIGTACLTHLGDAGFVPVAGWHRTAVSAARAIRFDTTDEDAVEAALEHVEQRWGPVEVVVCASGLAHLDLAVRIPIERFRQTVELDLTGPFLLARAAIRRMLPRRRGRVILIGSVAGQVGEPGVAPYSSSKAGLEGLARTIGREIGRRNVTVNVVAPGLIEDAARKMHRHRPPAQMGRWVDATPLGRVGTADEIASVVTFLASPAAGAITGSVLPVDGGRSLPPT